MLDRAQATISPLPSHSVPRQHSLPNLVTEIGPNRSLQLGGTVSDQVAQVLEVVTGGDAETANEVLGS
jgi:hypothetical protein